MRVSTLQTFTASVTHMQKSQASLTDLQQRISSGKALLRPSDDPVAAAQIIKLERELARVDQYQENVDVTRRRLELEELTLDQFDLAVTRLQELAIQGNNGTLTDANRAAVAAEMRQIQDLILGQMNTQDSQGEYLFAGSKGFTQPFTRNGDGTFNYEGDDGQRFIQVASQLRVASSDSGRDIFNVIPDDIAVTALGESADIGALTVSVTDPDTDVFRDTANKYGDITLDIATDIFGVGDYVYTLYGSDGNPIRDSGGNVITGPADLNTPIELDEVGLTLNYNGAVPANGPIVLRAQQGSHSVLTTIKEMIDTLEDPVNSTVSRERLNTEMAQYLEELSIAKEGALQVRTQVGARLNNVESASEGNLDAKLFTQTALSALEDLDYAEAISQFSLQETALQAAQATFSRVSQLSLFNYL